MSKIADSIEMLVHYVLNNLDVLTVNKIRTKARHDLSIDNGAGASIVLKGDQVLINGLSNGNGGDGDNVFDIIYIGQDRLCWLTRSESGNLVIHIPANKQLQFERGAS